jgi:hypothetical protein
MSQHRPSVSFLTNKDPDSLYVKVLEEACSVDMLPLNV